MTRTAAIGIAIAALVAVSSAQAGSVRAVAGEWHQLELTVSGRKVRGSVNGRLHVEHELDGSVSGPLGLWTKPDATSFP